MESKYFIPKIILYFSDLLNISVDYKKIIMITSLKFTERKLKSSSGGIGINQ